MEVKKALLDKETELHYCGSTKLKFKLEIVALALCWYVLSITWNKIPDLYTAIILFSNLM